MVGPSLSDNVARHSANWREWSYIHRCFYCRIQEKLCFERFRNKRCLKSLRHYLLRQIIQGSSKTLVITIVIITGGIQCCIRYSISSISSISFFNIGSKTYNFDYMFREYWKRFLNTEYSTGGIHRCSPKSNNNDKSFVGEVIILMDGQLGTVRNIYIIIVFVQVLAMIMYHTCIRWAAARHGWLKFGKASQTRISYFYIRISSANYHMYEILNFSVDLSYHSAVDSPS